MAKAIKVGAVAEMATVLNVTTVTADPKCSDVAIKSEIKCSDHVPYRDRFSAYTVGEECYLSYLFRTWNIIDPVAETVRTKTATDP